MNRRLRAFVIVLWRIEQMRRIGSDPWWVRPYYAVRFDIALAWRTSQRFVS